MQYKYHFLSGKMAFRRSAMCVSLGLVFSLCQCTPQTENKKSPKKGNAREEVNSSVELPGETVNAAVLENADGVTKAKIDPSVNSFQIINPSTESALGKAQVSFAPGSLIIESSISIEEGDNLISDDLSTIIHAELGNVKSGSPTLVVRNDQNVDAINPFAISLEIAPESSLTLSGLDYDKMIVIYRYIKASEGGQTFTGIIPRQDITFANNIATVWTQFFGAYQVVFADEIVESKIEVPSKAPILVKNALENLPEFAFKNLEVGFDAKSRKVYAQGFLTNDENTIANCTLQGDLDKVAPFDYANATDQLEQSLSLFLSQSNQMYFRYICTASDGRSIASEWSAAVALPGKSQIAPTIKSLLFTNGTTYTNQLISKMKLDSVSSYAYYRLGVGENCSQIPWNKVDSTKTISLTLSDAEGVQKVCAQIKDIYGQEDPAKIYTFTLDRMLPYIDLVTSVTTRSPLVVTANITDANLASYKWSKYSGLGNITFANANTLSPRISADSPGLYEIKLLATDLAGNSQSAVMSFNWDTVAPTFTSISLANEATNGYINLAERSTQNSLIQSLEAAGYSTVQYKLVLANTDCASLQTYGEEPLGNSPDFGADGTYKICLLLQDEAGNKTYAASSNIILDTIPPLIDAGSDLIVFDTTTITPTPASDANEPITYLWQQISGPVDGLIFSYLTSSPEVTIQGMKNGAYILQVTATDAAGNFTTDTVSFTWNGWRDLDAGGSYNCGIKFDETLWCWGANYIGQLGDNNTSVYRTIPFAIPDANTFWKSLSTGTSHSCAIKSDDTLWCWGNGGSGQLGNGTTATQYVPTEVSSGGQWSSVAAGVTNTCGILTNGSLWCWGANSFSQLGIPYAQATSSYVPLQIGTDSDWAKVVAGYAHTCALKTSGELYCWGQNSYGQVGDGTTILRDVPVQIAIAKTFTDISIGYYHTCAIDSGKKLSCWGMNYDGEVGNNTVTSQSLPIDVRSDLNWDEVSLGANHSCARQSTGNLWCWGLNTYFVVSETRPQRVLIPEKIDDNTHWIRSSGGYSHNCGLKEDGSIWCWGKNDYGQLANDSLSDITIPTQIGTDSDWFKVSSKRTNTCAIKNLGAEKGSLWCWGDNSTGQIGDGTILQRFSPTQVGPDVDWIMVRNGVGYACGLRYYSASNSSLYCWGINVYGQLGNNSTAQQNTPVLIGVAGEWSWVSTGLYHTCGLKTDNSLWCWGADTYGQIGNGVGTVPQHVPQNISNNWLKIALGDNHSCGIQIDNTLWCWGANDYGQLGLGNSTTPGPDVPTQVGSGMNWQNVTAGSTYTCATNSSNQIFCWGYNGFYQLGNAVYPGNNYPVQVGSNSNWTSLHSGSNHSCAINNSGNLYCWGYNWYSQLGDGNVLNKSFDPVLAGTINNTWLSAALGDYHSCGIKSDGTLWCWGDNSMHQIKESSQHFFKVITP